MELADLPGARSILLVATLAARAVVPARAAEPLSAFQKHAALFNMKCAKCHTIGRGDRVGPDLRGVTERRERDWILKFIMNPDAYIDTDPIAKGLRRKYNGVRMENTHLTRAEAEGLWEYLKAATTGPSAPAEAQAPPEEPLYRKLRMPDEGFAVFWPGVALLLLLSAGGAALLRAGSFTAGGGLLLVAIVTGYWSLGGRRYYHLLGNQQGYAPEQPVAFSHALHAGKLGISCLYCHHGAEKSDVAGVPSVNVCMNCHVAVRKASGADGPSPEIAKLVAVWETRTSSAPASIDWVRVHELPDFVHFSHRAHVNDNIQCQECHGPVQEMTRLRQASSLSMGFCISCHRQQEGQAPTHWKRAGGPLDCAACHW